MNGGLFIEETQPGKFAWIMPGGFSGTAEDETPLVPVLVDGVCEISFPGYKGLLGKLSFRPGEITARTEAAGATCTVQPGYRESLGQCKSPVFKPNETCGIKNPKAINLIWPNSTLNRESGSTPIRLLDGGAIITTYDRKKSKVYLTISRNNQQWCLVYSATVPTAKPTCLSAIPSEIRNRSGEVVAVAAVQGKNVLIKQTKQPHVTSGYEIASDSTVLKFSQNLNMTEASLQNATTGTSGPGIVQIIGDSRWQQSAHDSEFSLALPKKITSDCEGVKTEVNQEARNTLNDRMQSPNNR